MQILYHHRIASKDGQYIHLSAILGQLRRQGHAVELVGPKIIESSGLGAESGLVARLKAVIPGFAYELMEFGYNFLDFARLARAILRRRPDCIYERCNLYFVSGIWASKLFRIPLVLEINSPLYEERARYDSIALPALARWSERYVWRNAHDLYPVTRVLQGIVERAVTPRRLRVIPNGIDRAELAPRVPAEELRAQHGLAPDATIVGFVGFVRAWHKLERVIRFIAQRGDDPTLVLLIVGDGPDIPRLRALAAELGVAGQLTVTGVVEREQMGSYIALFDVAVQPAVTAYASPLKLFEYLELGCVVIAPDSANIAEVIRDGDNGLLFDDADDTDFSRVLGEALYGAGRAALRERAHATIDARMRELRA